MEIQVYSLQRGKEQSLLVCREERILGGYHDWLLRILLEHLRRHIFLADHKAEHKLVKPPVGHDQAAIHAVIGAPAVLHLPLQGLSMGI